MKPAAGSAWSQTEIERFFAEFDAPLRVAVNDDRGFPLLCSLWYRYAEGRLLCATQQDAKIARRLAADPRCAFELAPNEPPYYGVRGRGRAKIRKDGAEAVLRDLIDRFLGDGDASLRDWLLSRADGEVVLEIEIEWITSWDFRDRMAGDGDG